LPKNDTWRVVISVAEFVDGNALDTELASGVTKAIASVAGVTAVWRGDREQWVAEGEPNGHALVRSVASFVDKFATRHAVELVAPPIRRGPPERLTLVIRKTRAEFWGDAWAWRMVDESGMPVIADREQLLQRRADGHFPSVDAVVKGLVRDASDLIGAHYQLVEVTEARGKGTATLEVRK
jgi:hypothetical protein